MATQHMQTLLLPALPSLLTAATQQQSLPRRDQKRVVSVPPLCNVRGGFSAGAMYLAHSSRALDDIVSWKRELLCLKNGSYLSVPHAG